MNRSLIATLASLLVPAALCAQGPSKGITWTASLSTRVAPADAVQILQGNQSIANRTGLGSYPAEGWPLVASTGASPTDGPFGPFVPFYQSLPDRRLDGSLWSDPPWTAWPYGFGFGGSFGSGFSHARSFAGGGTGLFTPRLSRGPWSSPSMRVSTPAVRSTPAATSTPVVTRPAMGGTAPRQSSPSRR